MRRPSILANRRLHQLVQAAAFCSWATLAVLSLVPGRDRPHTGASGNAEHFLAYVLAAAVTRMAFRETASRWQVLAFSAASAVFEVCQIWIPGRQAGLANWATSSAGALVGIVVVRSLVHAAGHRAET